MTITHQSTDDLREKLRSKLEKLVNPVDDIEEAEFMDAEPIDVDEELGMPDEEEEVEEEYDDEEECPSQP